MTNEELVALIQSGERDKLEALWEQVERFISMRARKTALALDGYGGVTAEDLYQSGYFALVAAVRDYDPARGCKFLSYLSTHLKTAFAEAGGSCFCAFTVQISSRSAIPSTLAHRESAARKQGSSVGREGGSCP